MKRSSVKVLESRSIGHGLIRIKVLVTLIVDPTSKINERVLGNLVKPQKPANTTNRPVSPMQLRMNSVSQNERGIREIKEVERFVSELTSDPTDAKLANRFVSYVIRHGHINKASEVTNLSQLQFWSIIPALKLEEVQERELFHMLLVAASPDDMICQVPSEAEEQLLATRLGVLITDTTLRNLLVRKGLFSLGQVIHLRLYQLRLANGFGTKRIAKLLSIVEHELKKLGYSLDQFPILQDF